ncbi:hypothetical protein Ccrd_009022, partial [Cynara cardunculus var. scolymus]
MTTERHQVPIVASTGGLVETVKEGYTGFQMGASNVEVTTTISYIIYINTVTRALTVYGTPAFSEMIQNCMAQELSWKV